MKTLHLVLKHKWYDKIASGEKTSEYRAVKPCWNKKFAGGAYILLPSSFMSMRFEYKTEYKTVVFHKGYTNETMEFEIAGIYLIQNIPNDLNTNPCWEIKLGKRLK